MSNRKGNERNTILLIPFKKKNVVEKKKFYDLFLAGFFFFAVAFKQLKTPNTQTSTSSSAFAKIHGFL